MRTVRYIWIGMLLLLSLTEGMAQHFPIQATFYSKPPYPIKLSDYANPLGQNISLKVVLRDLNLGPTQVYFRFAVSSSRANYSNLSHPGNVPLFTLTPGVVQTFTQADFGRNFTWDNLGISPTVYSLPLAEGIYNFSVEIIDVLTNKSLSGAVPLPPVWLVVNDPPLLSSPTNQGNAKIQNPQNLIFQWIPRHRQATAVEYEFILTELVVPANYKGNLQNLFLAQPPYYQATTTNTTLLFGPSLPPLIPGRTYGFRVRAKAKMGFEEVGIFRNDGYSEVFVFQYGEKNRPPTILSAKWGDDGKALVTWSGIDQQIQFDVHYQKTIATAEASFPFFSLSHPALQKLGNNTYTGKITAPLDAQSEYRFRVGGISNVSGDEILFSTPVVLGPIDWSKITVNGITRDNGDYLALLAGKSRKKNPTPLVATCQNPTVNPTDQTKNAVAMGDTLHVGGTDAIVMSSEYAQVRLKTTGGGWSAVKLYFSVNFLINQFNEVISGYLTSEATGQKVNLLTTDGAIESGPITDKQLITLGVRADSLKTLANQLYDQSTQNLKLGIGRVAYIRNQLPQLGQLLSAKQTAIQAAVDLINTKIQSETNSQKRQDFQKLKTQLDKQSQENQKNVANLTTFNKYYLGYSNAILFGLLPRLFL